MAVEFYLPKMSDHMDEGRILKWLAKEGDYVSQGQLILELETDKVSADIESPASGILRGIRKGAEEGATVPVGETLAFIAATDEQIPDLPPLSSAVGSLGDSLSSPAFSTHPDSPAGKPEDKAPPDAIRASPASRKLAKELGISLTSVKGTGPRGRITEEDVRQVWIASSETEPRIEKPPGATPVAGRIASELGVAIGDLTGTGPGGKITGKDVLSFVESQMAVRAGPDEAGDEWQELTSVQRITGRRMLASVQTAPQFNLTISVDMTEALRWQGAIAERVLAETGARLSITAILIRVVAQALARSPRINASFVDGRIRLHRQVNIGVAIGSDQGVIVPVIKEADHKSLNRLATELKQLLQKSQQAGLSLDDLSGGTFTISNLGMYGVERFTAIVNPPESAILAAGRIVKTPVGLPDDTIALRPIMQLTLSADHRTVDGVQGSHFLAQIKEQIENPYLLI